MAIKNVSKTTYFRVLVAEDIVNVLNTSCHLISKHFKVDIKPALKKPKKVIIKATVPAPKSIVVANKKDTIAVAKSIVKPKLIDTDKLPKTYKDVVIVKNGHKIITDKVWIDGVVGKYVQTTEKVTKQGHDRGDIVINETLYYRSVYGYNCVKRTYSIKAKP
ncbi:hypothetical protein EYD45_12165 [Hyunsoonleella flava]|uniref:Uncharacterized protein n=1 Tax=Hyunsoonleella flava TaxID=2527939 RepID=A0A4Q9FD78_9FLAO|nr:hypothetical protein [Hyunsoonleella flava]TBN02456.1 hypothetical protein EYD45_12165 [Hyunsoonleella flava]